MGGVKTTAENLKAAMEGESYEYKSMYPKFVADAEAEQNKPAAHSFKAALAVEKIHHGFYSSALAEAEQGKDMPATQIFVCDVCGNTVMGGPEEKCSVCGAPKNRFFEVK